MNLHIDKRHLNIVCDILKNYDYSFFAFGSRVTGKNKEFSDLDIFYFDQIPNNDILIIEEAFEESDLPFKVDLVDYKKCDIVFQNIILQNYICIKPSSSLKKVGENHLGHFVFLPKNLGFNVNEIDGVTVVSSEARTSMFNIAYGLPESPQKIQSIGMVKQVFENKPFAWWIPQDQHDPEFTAALLNAGLIIETVEHAMVRDLSDIGNLVQKTSLVIAPVINSSLLQDFVSVLEEYDSHVLEFYGKMPDELFESNERLVVGYSSGKPVAIGILYISNGSAGIFSIITKEDQRKKGYGTDIMIFLMIMAKKNGCNLVTLSSSSSDGERIYESLGFAKVGTFECFEKL